MRKSVGCVHMSVSVQRDPMGLELQMAVVCPALVLGIKFSELSAAEPPLQPLPSLLSS